MPLHHPLPQLQSSGFHCKKIPLFLVKNLKIAVGMKKLRMLNKSICTLPGEQMNGLFVALFPPLSIFVCMNLSQVEPRNSLHQSLALIVVRTLHANFYTLQMMQSTLVECAIKKEIKVDNPYSVTCLIRIPFFEWYVGLVMAPRTDTKKASFLEG